MLLPAPTGHLDIDCAPAKGEGSQGVALRQEYFGPSCAPLSGVTSATSWGGRFRRTTRLGFLKMGVINPSTPLGRRPDGRQRRAARGWGRGRRPTAPVFRGPTRGHCIFAGRLGDAGRPNRAPPKPQPLHDAALAGRFADKIIDFPTTPPRGRKGGRNMTLQAFASTGRRCSGHVTSGEVPTFFGAAALQGPEPRRLGWPVPLRFHVPPGRSRGWRDIEGASPNGPAAAAAPARRAYVTARPPWGAGTRGAD